MRLTPGPLRLAPSPLTLPCGQPFTLHEFGEVDVTVMHAIEKRVSSFPWTQKNFLDSVNSSHLCVGVKDDVRWCAYAVFSLVAGEAELLILAVDPDYQGKKIATTLLNHMETQLCPVADALFLEVRASNAPAIALYESLGFHHVGERVNYYPSAKGREDALIYAKQFFKDDAQ